MMKILVTNDDGTNAPGLWALARSMQPAGEVTVAAPDRENSGVGTSVSLHNPVRLNKLPSRIEGIDSYSVEGTPADAAVIGIKMIMKDRADLIVSGINSGRNIGNDVYISGTVGAAMQGHFHGVPAIAVSVSSYENAEFGPAARLCAILAGKVETGALPRRLLLNVNFPNLPLEKIRGVAITRLGQQVFGFTVKEWEDRQGYYRLVRTTPAWEEIKGSDRWAIDNDYISITALLEISRAPIVKTLKDMAAGLWDELRG
jgi:5'-nucleotidase